MKTLSHKFYGNKCHIVKKEKNTEFYLQKGQNILKKNSASLKWHCLIPVCVGERDGGGYKNLVHGGFKLGMFSLFLLLFLCNLRMF